MDRHNIFGQLVDAVIICMVSISFNYISTFNYTLKEIKQNLKLNKN